MALIYIKSKHQCSLDEAILIDKKQQNKYSRTHTSMWRANDGLCVWKQEKDWHFVVDYLGTSIESRAQMAIYESIKYKKKTIASCTCVETGKTHQIYIQHSNNNNIISLNNYAWLTIPNARIQFYSNENNGVFRANLLYQFKLMCFFNAWLQRQQHKKWLKKKRNTA